MEFVNSSIDLHQEGLDIFSALYGVILLITSVENVIAIATSAFIVAVIFMDWAKGKSLTTCDIIMVALGISYTWYQCIEAGKEFISEALSENLKTDYNTTVLFLLQLWNCSTSCWLTACLSIFYSVRIVDFKHLLFFWLKQRISKAVPWLILWSLVVSLIFNVPVNWIAYQQFTQNATTNLTINSTFTVDQIKSSSYYILTIVLGFLVPVVFCVASITLILTSLIRHTWLKLAHLSRFSQPRWEAHYGAARVVGSLLLIYILFLMAEIVFLLSPTHWLNTVLETIVASSMPAQSNILILGTPKLSGTLKRILSPWRKWGANTVKRFLGLR